MHIATAVSLAALTVAGLSPAMAQPGTDVLRGHLFAHHVCGQCHAVDQGRYVSPNTAAPPFESIMSQEENTDMVLLVWLHTPHQSMPDIRVESQDLQDLIAYMSSLRPAVDD